MVSITKLALAIVTTLQPLCVIGISEQAGKFSQDQFEALIEKIPDNNVRNHVVGLYDNKNYNDLEVSLLEYLDEYMESSLKDEDREVIERKKENIIHGVAGFIENAAEARGFEDIDSYFEDEDEDEDKPVSQINLEKAIAKFNDVIENYLLASKKEDAYKILNEEKDYWKLETFLFMNINPEKNMRTVVYILKSAKDLLWHSYDSSEDSSFSEDADVMTKDSFKQDSISFEDSEVMMIKKSVTPAEVAKATLEIQEIVRDYIPLAKQLNATKLLTNKKYYDLERYIYDNIDMDKVFGDGDDDDDESADEGYEVFNNLDSAIKTLHKSVGEPEDHEPISNSKDPSMIGNSTMFQENDLFESSMMTDSLSNEEDMISALKNSIAKTEEEIEELISRLNTNEEN